MSTETKNQTLKIKFQSEIHTPPHPTDSLTFVLLYHTAFYSYLDDLYFLKVK